MRRLVLVFFGFWVLLATAGGVWAASEKAMALRQANGLVAFTPTENFLVGNFVADEMNPMFIFGPVKKFAASRQGPTSWLMEAGDKNEPADPEGKDKLMEHTVYLEEDGPDKVVYYVFIDQSGLTPQQWIDWREKFHRSKAEPAYGQAKSKLEKACQDGCGFTAELRFIQKDGELQAKSPEEVLRLDLKFPPIYDLNLQKKISK